MFKRKNHKKGGSNLVRTPFFAPDGDFFRRLVRCARQRASPPRSGVLRCGLFARGKAKGSQNLVGAARHVFPCKNIFCQEFRDQPRYTSASRGS